MGPCQTLTVTPRMWATSKREACSRQCLVEAMMESLYWTGMSHPWKSTILPAGMGQTEVSVTVQHSKSAS